MSEPQNPDETWAPPGPPPYPPAPQYPPAYPQQYPPAPYPPQQYPPQQYPPGQYPPQQYPPQQYPQGQYPPQYYPPQYYPPGPGYPMQPYAAPVPQPRRIRGYAIAAIIGSALLAGVQLATAITAWPSGSAYGEAWQRGESSDFTASWDVVGYFFLPAVPLAYVLGSLWLWHARTNVESMDPGTKRFLGRGWAWGGWVTPVVALWFPVLVVRDTIKGSIPGARTALALSAWWSLWLLWLLTEPWVSGVIFDKAPESTHLLGIFETAAAVVGLGALALWIRTIVQVTRAQQSWLDERDRPVAPAGPPAASVTEPSSPWIPPSA